jgi:hypothetical protein
MCVVKTDLSQFNIQLNESISNRRTIIHRAHQVRAVPARLAQPASTRHRAEYADDHSGARDDPARAGA